MFTRGFLETIRLKAIRRRVLFRVLDGVDRGILYLCTRIVEKVSSPVLGAQLVDIVSRLQDALKSGFEQHVLLYGARRLVQVVRQAVSFGYVGASSWVLDKGFMRYLAFQDFNQTQGYRGFDGS